MRALTLTQPWATLVIRGRKQVETRSWSTPYRGPLAIHAAAGWTADDREFAADLMDAGVLPQGWVTTNRSIKPDLPLGRILGTVRLVGVIPTFALVEYGPRTNIAQHVIGPLEREYGDYSPGRFAWLLADVEPFPEPIPARGALGLWDWSAPA